MVRGLLLLGLLLLMSPFVNAAEEKETEPSPEFRAFAQQLVKLMETQDRQALADLIDFDHILVQSSFAKCEFDSPLSRIKFYLGFTRVCKDIEKPFYKKIMPESDLVTLMQLKKITAQESEAIIRYFSDGVSMYSAFRIAEDENKLFKVIDVSGCSPVTSFTTGIELGVLPMHKYPFIKNMGHYEPLRAWLDMNKDLYADFAKAINTEDLEAVIKLYPQLLPAIQKMPAVEFQFYRANSVAEKPVLKLAEMQAYHAKHQDLGTLVLVRDYCHSQNEGDALLATYDQIDQLLGNDPLNNLHRANALIDNKKFPKAYECSEQLIKDYPEWKWSQITLMVVSLFDKNYKLTLKQLQLLRDKFELDLVELVDTDDDYKDFRKSPEYAVWKKENDAAGEQNKK